MKTLTKTLGKICDEVGGIIRTGPFGSQLHESDYKPEGIPVIMPKNIIDGKITINDIARIGEKDALRLAQHKLRVGEIVYGRRGDIGRRALVTEQEAGWLCGTGCLRLSLGTTLLDPKFLYYYLGQTDVIAWIYNQAIGATLPNLNTNILRSVSVTYPEISVQRRIAAVLSAYDDLIENNQRRIAILEEMASNLYREWFVHLRFPGHEGVEIVERDGMRVPEGWEVETIRAVSSYINRGISPKYSDISRSLVINQKCIRNGKLNLELARHHDSKVIQEKQVQYGDVLINSTGVGTLGRVAQVYQIIEDCTADSHVSIVRPNDRVGLDYFGFHLLSLEQIFESSGVGSTGQTELGRERIATTEFLLPPKELQLRFGELVMPMRNGIHRLLEKNDVLRRTRDLLLPRLICGELDVSELEITQEKPLELA